MSAYTVGTLAYFDSLGAGLVKVKVVGAKVRDLGGLELKLRVTARSNKVFRHGEEFETSEVWVIPRTAFHKSRRGPFYIWTTPYKWEVK